MSDEMSGGVDDGRGVNSDGFLKRRRSSYLERVLVARKGSMFEEISGWGS